MKQNRIFGLILIAISALTLGYCDTGKIEAFGIFATLAALVGAFSNINIKMRPSRKAIAILLIALLFAAYYRSTHEGSFVDGPAQREQWLMFARYAIVVSIFYLFVNRKENVPPTIIIFLSVSVLVLPNIIDEMTPQAIILSMLYVVALSLFCLSSQKMNVTRFSGMKIKIAIFSVILAISVVAGYFGGSKLVRYNDDIAMYLMNIHPAPNFLSGRSERKPRDEVEFGQLSDLESVMLERGSKSRKMVARVFSPESPGYLRSKPYEKWDGTSWKSNPEEEPGPRSIDPLETGYPGWPYEERDNYKVFRLEYFPGSVGPDSGNSEDYNFYDIWPAPAYDWIFLPTDCRFVQMVSDKLMLSRSLMVEYTSDHTQGSNYQAAVPKEPGSGVMTDEQLVKYLELPADWLDYSIRRLTDEVTANCKTDVEKIHAVQWYFLSNYTYTVSPKFPERVRNRIKYFLLNKVDSYCEYFATGTVLLLRAAGVPARYVVGYYVSERDTITECWVARQRDAHAWAEAWDSELGRWVVVESTPSDGVPQAGQGVSLLGNYYDYFMYKFQELKVTLGQSGLTGLRLWLSEALYNAIQWLFTTMPGYILLAFCGILLLLRSGRKIQAYRNRPTVSQRVKLLNRQLARMDRRMGRMGLRRGIDETIRQFADRIDDSKNFKQPEKKALVVNWYLNYEKDRYCNNELGS